MDGSIDPYQNTTEGAVIVFGCNPGFVPAGNMTAVCGPAHATLARTIKYYIIAYYVTMFIMLPHPSAAVQTFRKSQPLSKLLNYQGSLIVHEMSMQHIYKW